jgi:ATP-dependent helicase/nuclease subunit B
LNLNTRCIAHLEAGGLLLTRDLRQARILRRLHDRAQVSAGRKVWPSARVLPIDAWLALQWQKASADRPSMPAILPAVALHWLWWRQAARDAPGLLDPADLGEKARASWLRLRAHGGDLAKLSPWPLTRDQQAFLSWAGAVESELRSRHGWDGADLARLLVEADAVPGAGPPVLVSGFRRLTPAVDALLAAMSAKGWTVGQVKPQARAGSSWRYAARDPESERVAMLSWLRERLEQSPDGIHALVVPDLDEHRGTLERALASALQPERELPEPGRDERLFDLAGGHALASQPIVDTALAAIACAAGPIDWIVASRLLRSPHLAAPQSERAARIAADLSLRKQPGQARATGTLLARRALQEGATVFAASSQAAGDALSGARRRSAGAWAEVFGTCLAAWGWPGAMPPGSRQYQAARRFRELILEFASLAAVAPDLDAAQALDELRRLAAAPFQEESGEPAVFVLDTYEDPGVHFDSLWVAGLTATVWPRPVIVDPLLPIEIQRQLGMPGVTPEDCVADSRAIVDCWRSQSSALVLSWPTFENDTDVDGSPLLPADSPMLEPPPALPSRERLAFEAARLEPVPDAAALPLASALVPGGARVLELQSQCAFRAFAELRLSAAPLEEPQAGFDRRLRGIVLHRALQTLWSALRTQEGLAKLDGAARESRIAGAVDEAIAAVAPAGTGVRMFALERDWQSRAIGHLFDLDLARPPFTVVETERALALSIGGLELKLRVDRVDRVGEELIVIDYKTGKVQSSAWRGARMDAPQLPLYAVLHPDHPAGLAFAGLGAARAKYVGVSRDGQAFSGLQPAAKFPLTEDKETGFEWPQLVAHWHAWLARLAEDFAAGRAEVNPKLAADTCRRCHLETLCRVEAAASRDADEEDSDGE